MKIDHALTVLTMKISDRSLIMDVIGLGVVLIFVTLLTSCTTGERITRFDPRVNNKPITSQQAIEAERDGNHEKAISLLTKLAEQGDPQSMIHLGNKYYRGEGVKQDYDKSMDWWLKAYKNGSWDAPGKIGVMYRDGKGVKQNRKIAYLLFGMTTMEGLVTQRTRIHINKLLRREKAELLQEDRQEALCYTKEYLLAYLEARGKLESIPSATTPAAGKIRFKDYNWWPPSEKARMNFVCKPPFNLAEEQDKAYYEKNTEAHVYKNDSGQTMPYRLFVPQGYDPKKQYPLLLSFHGAGKRGNDNLKHLASGIAGWVDEAVQKIQPCFILMPQCPTGQQWVDTPWGKGSYSISRVPISKSMTMAKEIFDKILKERSIDKNRIYVTGSSMGGYATWDFTMRYPDIVAAAVPNMGGGDPSMAESIKHIPIWAHHGDRDNIVPPSGSIDMIDAIKKAGGTKSHITIYKGLGHTSYAWREPKLINWIFKQRKME